MTSAQETVQTIQKALEPYIRPREEAEHIRRVLALHLHSCQENGPDNGLLALADPSFTIKPTPEVRGLQREYLKALNANIKAQKGWETASKQYPSKTTPNFPGSSSSDTSNRLEEHLTTIKLQKKQAKLQTVEKYLDLLVQKPATSEDFLQPDEIFRDAKPLPEVPKDVVNGFAVDKGSAKTDIRALVDRLEKAVLRSKLLLRKEEKLLKEVKSRSSPQPGEVSDGAKVAALSATRNELIQWIETELGNASGQDDSVLVESDANASGRSKAAVDRDHMDERLATIKHKYASYIAARKTLIQLVAQSPQPSIKPAEEDSSTTLTADRPPPPTTHLMSLYVDSLLSLAYEQKASITQKSHLNNILAKQMKETCQMLDHLADESQLLPAFPMTGSLRRKQGLGNDLSKGLDVTSHVKPWVFAADSSKIATLEAVFEKVEEGQHALEASTKSLDEVDQLLGRDLIPGEDAGEEDASNEDIWLVETRLAKGAAARRPIRSKNENTSDSRDIWSVLDGNLGLINAEDSPRR